MAAALSVEVSLMSNPLRWMRALGTNARTIFAILSTTGRHFAREATVEASVVWCHAERSRHPYYRASGRGYKDSSPRSERQFCD
jgi:hypothetical protein